MVINKELRKKAIRRILKRYEKLQSKANPYGFNADDAMKFYYLIEYWEGKLTEINQNKEG
jgi:hypothetical protein